MNEDNTPTVQTIMVKLLDGIDLSGVDNGTTIGVDDLITQAGVTEGPEATAVKTAAPDLALSWAFVSVSRGDIAALLDRANSPDPETPDTPDDGAGYTPPMFDHFFEIVCTDDMDAPGLAATLAAWTDVVEYAYVVDIATDTNVVAVGNPLYNGGSQNYLAAAPDGIGADAAWAKGADGSGLTFIDIEQGWFLGHDDLPQTITLLQGTNRPSSFAHGCGVLGEIVGIDNQTGIVGTAPEATAEVLSYNDDLTSGLNKQRVADRILSAAKALPFGNVMLLEIQFEATVGGTATLLPVESDPLVFEAIKLATKVGVVVVQAGGNGGFDLDTFVMDKGPQRGKQTLARSNPTEFMDSGAIMVGAALSAAPHDRPSFSNFGSRIDCFAWGQNIVTTGWDPARPTASNLYWGIDLEDANGNPRFFGGTSGASPIIVGCCLLLQSLRGLLTPKSGSGKLGPFSMRRCLSNVANGTASAQSTDAIGVMPDLAKIIDNEFQP